MNDLITWFSAHYADILKAVASIVLAARIIVKLTPTPKDDTWLAKTVDFLGHIGLKLPLILSAFTLASCTTTVDQSTDAKGVVHVITTKRADIPVVSAVSGLVGGIVGAFVKPQPNE